MMNYARKWRRWMSIRIKRLLRQVYPRTSLYLFPIMCVWIYVYAGMYGRRPMFLRTGLRNVACTHMNLIVCVTLCVGYISVWPYMYVRNAQIAQVRLNLYIYRHCHILYIYRH